MTSKLTKGISSPNKIAFSAPTMCYASPEPLTHLEGPVKLSAGLRAIVVYVGTNGIRENIQKQIGTSVFKTKLDWHKLSLSLWHLKQIPLSKGVTTI